MQKGFTTAYFFVILLIIAAFYLGRITSTKPLVQKTLTPSASPVANNESLFPTVISEKKDLKINDRSNEVNMKFDGWEKTTYKETKYFFEGKEFVVLDLKLPNENILGQIQKFNTETDKYLDFVYEGVNSDSLYTLFRELDQPVGKYPASIHNGAYEIFVNRNNIKMKKKYYQVPGYLVEEVEFVVPILYDVHYINRYYSFTTSIFIAETGKTIEQIKNNPPKEFQELEAFIDTINSWR